MKIYLNFLLLLLLTSCNEDLSKPLPEGFTVVSKDGNAHFVLVSQKYWGDRYTQRAVGTRICSQIYKASNYCEVYFFANKDDIPRHFPIINRTEPMGIYAMKSGKRTLKSLPSAEKEYNSEGVIVFFKNIYKNYIWGKKN